MLIAKLASFSLLAGFLLAAPLPVLAAKIAPDLATLDPDHDGTVSLAEVLQAGATKFDALNPDHDGTLDKNEAKGVLPKDWFKKVDTDSDGTVDKTEYSTAIAASFKKADPDGDGTLDAKELSSPAGQNLLKLIQ